MDELVDVRLVEIVGSRFCLASDEGQKVHDAIAAGIRDGKRVRLSFRDVEALTSAFLNVAVGQLYGEFSEEEIRARLSVGEASQDDLVLLKRVVDRAKEFFRDPKQFQTTAKDLLGEDGEP